MAPPFASRDAELLDRIRKGEEGALVELYRENRSAVSALVRHNSGTADDADDILQEALITLWERVRTGRFHYSARLGTFLYATARNIWRRRLARNRRELKGTEAEAATDDPSPLELLIEGEEAAIVQHAIAELGEPCRRLLLLFYWEEMPLASIASAMGMANAETVKSRKYQCKKALEALLRGRLPSYD